LIAELKPYPEYPEELAAFPSDMRARFRRIVEHVQGPLWEMRIKGATEFRALSVLLPAVGALLLCGLSSRRHRRLPAGRSKSHWKAPGRQGNNGTHSG
jgi:hypothetical protein